MTNIDTIINTIDRIEVKHNSVIVYDIDNTLIDQYGQPIHAIIYTYNYAKMRGLKPVIITARKSFDSNIYHTRQQLKNFGITDYIRIYFLPEEKDNQPVFKLLSRKNLHDNGYQVEMSLGDMPWDIGEYGGVGFIV